MKRSHARPHLLLTLPFLALAGCSSTPEAKVLGPTYPREMQQFAVLDIQVFRRSTTMEFTNTTPRAFGKSTVWLNTRFSKPIDSIAVGESVVLDLEDFVDHNGDRFKAGGFFAGYIPDIISLAQLETTTNDGKPILLGLVTVKAGAN